jgi:hypothetical protein
MSFDGDNPYFGSNYQHILVYSEFKFVYIKSPNFPNWDIWLLLQEGLARGAEAGTMDFRSSSVIW